MLGSLDAADHAAGIVRVDTNDEALVERVRRVHVQHAIRTGGYEAGGKPMWTSWECLGCNVALRDGNEAADHLARAVLTTLREAAQ